MKKIIYPLLFLGILFTACENNKAKKVTTESNAQVEALEKENETLERTTDDIEAKAAALDKALEALDE